jgi:hypothetical protein
LVCSTKQEIQQRSYIFIHTTEVHPIPHYEGPQIRQSINIPEIVTKYKPIIKILYTNMLSDIHNDNPYRQNVRASSSVIVFILEYHPV